MFKYHLHNNKSCIYRQSTIIVQQSDIIIFNITSVGNDSRVIFYVQTASGGVLSAINLLAAVNVG